MIEFSDFNPAVIAIWFFSAAGVAMFSNHPMICGITLIGGILLYVTRNKFTHMKSHLFFLVLFLMLALANPIVSHNGKTVLFVMNDNPVTLESLLYGINSAAMIVGVLYLFRSFTQIMTSEKLLYVTGRISPKIAMILSMAIRYVPLFSRQGQKVSDTQKALGLYSDDNIIDDISGHMRVFSVIATWGLENGIITADSMEARGCGIGRRSQMRRFNFKLHDGLFLALTVALTAICGAASAMGELSFSFYPSIGSDETGFLGKSGILAYALLLLMPVIIETEVSLRWKYLQSKI